MGTTDGVSPDDELHCPSSAGRTAPRSGQMGGGTVELGATVIPGWQEEQKLLLKHIPPHRHTQVHQAGGGGEILI